MSRKLVTAYLTVTVFLAIGLVFNYLQYRDSVDSLGLAEDDLTALQGRCADLEEELRQLQGELDLSLKREGLLEERLRSEREALVTARREAAERAPESDDHEGASTATRPEGAELREPDLVPVTEADEAAKTLLARGDLEGIWQLGFDLLFQGEEGYEKLIELARLLDDRDTRERMIGQLWRDQEMFLGKFLGEAMVNSEAVLRFGLYLQGRPEVTGMIGELRRELSEETGGAMLGAYRGDDRELLDGYRRLYESQIQQEIDGGGINSSRDAIRNLAHVNTRESTDFLVSLFDVAPKSFHETILRAIAFHRTSYSGDVLRNLQETPVGRENVKLLEAAIRLQE